MSAPKKKGTSPVFWIVLIIGLIFAVPCCIGVVSAIAIPQLVGYQQRAKTEEARANLRNLFTSAAAYYAEEHRAPDGTFVTGCTVPSATTPNAPGPEKTALYELPESFEALGVSFADPVYYEYEIVSPGGCGHPAGADLYSFRARGDLDGDGVESLFEISARSDANNTLTRSPGIYTEAELE